ncbi:MAG: hypothetical protein LBB88_06715 [Planctomycetaceae bacterium]|nr:hypothetical protein [Planctomycetaceae bacterium]
MSNTSGKRNICFVIIMNAHEIIIANNNKLKTACRDAMPCVSLFDQKITDRDAKHCVSTLGLAI